MLRSEFLGRGGSPDLYAKGVKGLQREEKRSLKVFLDACAGWACRKHRLVADVVVHRT